MDTAPSAPSLADEPDSVAQRAARLADYIRTLPDFMFVERQAAHGHMGATIAEATLQAGMRYHAQVVPRVAHILETYPEATTSKAFLAALDKDTPEAVIDIYGRKARYTYALTSLLATEGVRTEDELRGWLEDPEHVRLLLDVRGIGNKTVSYLRLLVGSPDAVAVDTRMRTFLGEADVPVNGYDDTVSIVTGAAKLLGVTPATLDVSIWRYAERR
ncbi:MAG: hypothetical protein WCG26_14930 [Chloroflexales bacterium]